ncbi:hypothetical protein I552_4065 [Mycobacterium xenopi 3993]|nr:hypothetical protein I552_4065 [Mycobacterium xenopi 3993]
MCKCESVGHRGQFGVVIASRQSRHHVRRLTPKACNQLAGPLSSGYVDEKSRCCPARRVTA